jgi:hypothetical protein
MSSIYNTPQTIVLRKNNGKVIYIASSDEAAIDAGHELNQRGKGKASRVARLVTAGAPIPYEMQGDVLDGSDLCKAEWAKRSESLSALRVWLLARLSLTEDAVHSTPGHSGQFNPAISTILR